MIYSLNFNELIIQFNLNEFDDFGMQGLWVVSLEELVREYKERMMPLCIEGERLIEGEDIVEILRDLYPVESEFREKTKELNNLIYLYNTVKEYYFKKGEINEEIFLDDIFSIVGLIRER